MKIVTNFSSLLDDINETHHSHKFRVESGESVRKLLLSKTRKKTVIYGMIKNIPILNIINHRIYQRIAILEDGSADFYPKNCKSDVINFIKHLIREEYKR